MKDNFFHIMVHYLLRVYEQPSGIKEYSGVFVGEIKIPALGIKEK